VDVAADSPSVARGLRLAGVAQLADILASVAVLITLIFLALEVRQNTEVTRATAYARSVDSLNQWRLAIATDPDLSMRWQAYVTNNLEAQPHLADIRLQLLLNTIWAIYESSYYADQYGLLGSSESERHRAQTCARYRADEAQFTEPLMGQPLRQILTQEFVRYVESVC
jgi:hypothetical protein